MPPSKRASLSRKEAWQLGAVIALGAALPIALRSTQTVGVDVGDRPTVQAIRTDDGSPTSENPQADVTVIIFGDFLCPACRKAHPELKRAIAEDGRVRVVYKDWPIFGPISERAARVAIASNYQGLYPQIYDAFMSSPSLNDRSLRSIVERSGGSWDRIEVDLRRNGSSIDQRLQSNRLQAFTLGLEGTPGYLIGPILIKGAATSRQFSLAIAQARKA